MIRLGIDIGGTKIHAGLIRYEDGEAEVVARRRLEVCQIRDLLGELCTAVDGMCRESGIIPTEIAACGVGIPGTVSRDGKRILKAPNISLLCADFADRLGEVLPCPVSLIQDSRAAAWGEYLCGGGRGCACVVCVTLGTGIGTGIVLDGKVYHGALGAAGELGHLPVVHDGRPCGCGKRGCLEKYCAGGGLDITARELLGEGKRAADLFAAASEGDPAAVSAIDDAVVLLGRALVSVVNLLSPNSILLSGGMSREEGFVERIAAYVRTHCYSADGILPDICPAVLGELAPLIGAALADLSR